MNTYGFCLVHCRHFLFINRCIRCCRFRSIGFVFCYFWLAHRHIYGVSIFVKSPWLQPTWVAQIDRIVCAITIPVISVFYRVFLCKPASGTRIIACSQIKRLGLFIIVFATVPEVVAVCVYDVLFFAKGVIYICLYYRSGVGCQLNNITMPIIQVITNSVSLLVVYERKPTVIFSYCVTCLFKNNIRFTPKMLGRACAVS